MGVAVRMDTKTKSSKISVGLKQACVISLWLFNIHIHGWMQKRDESQSERYGCQDKVR